MRELLSILRARLRAFWKRRELDRDLQEELSFHLAEKQRELEGTAGKGEEARLLARRRFGNESLLKEKCREAWTFRGFENSLRDAKYALRVLAESPAFTTIAILTLAFGIGANTAIFSVIRSVVLEALPYRQPSQLYAIHEVVQQGAKRQPLTCVNAGNFLLWTQHAHSFSGLALLEPTNDNLDLADGAVPIHGVSASANLFEMLGTQLQMGRPFSSDEDRVGRGNSIVLANALWARYFHSDPEIVGKKILVNGFPFIVAGVLPESFYFPKQSELYSSTIAGWTHPIEYFTNLELHPEDIRPGMSMFNFAAIGRLRSGVTAEEATQQLDVAEGQVPTGGVSGVKMQIDLESLKMKVVGPAGQKLWMLMAGAALVLLLVCINLAGLLIAKAMGRTHEIAVRAALGASRVDILRQFLIEGVLLSIAGGALGLLAAYGVLKALVRTAPIEIPRLSSIAIDPRVLLFNLGIAIGAGLAFSIIPALWVTRNSSADEVKAAGPNATSRKAISRVHQALAMSEIALCTVLLVCAVLIAQSLVRVLKANAWANVSHVVTIDFGAPPAHYQEKSPRLRLYTTLLEKLRDLPGVEAAGITNALPFRGGMWENDVNFVEAPKSEIERPNANWRFVSPDYFRAMGQALVSGRYLSQFDFGKHRILISEGLAKQLPRALNPVGAHILWTPPGGTTPIAFEIVGVVADARARPDEQAPFVVYFPYWEWPPWETALVVRTAGDPRSLALAMERLIRRTDREIAPSRAETLHEILSEATAPRQFATVLGLLFAGSATFLAALGLYGLISLSASLRTREIGIRIAVGAPINEISRWILRQAIVLAAVGLGCGVACGWATTRLLSAFLYDVKPNDPLTFVCVSVGLLLVSVLASSGPARRAARVDPVKALKWE